MTNEELKIISEYYTNNKDKFKRILLSYPSNGVNLTIDTRIEYISIKYIDLDSYREFYRERTMSTFYNFRDRHKCVVLIKNAIDDNVTFIPLSNIISITLKA